jgi:hypothetical protein
MPLIPHVEAAAIALMALQDEPQSPPIFDSLSWLRRQTAKVTAVSSLEWSILSLFFIWPPRAGSEIAAGCASGRSVAN